MDDILFDIVKVVVTAICAIIARYVVPYVKVSLDNARMKKVRDWVKDAVQMAQQLYKNEDGEYRKAVVLKFMHEQLAKENIKVTNVQLDALIESAYKTMKMEEAKKNVSNSTGSAALY